MPWTQNYDPTGSEIAFDAGGNRAGGGAVGHAGAAGLVGSQGGGGRLDSVVGGGDRRFTACRGSRPWRRPVIGACYGMFPIGWIVFTAVFMYVLTVEAGEFEKVKASVAALSSDRRIQALLIAFSFGAFIEGAAGFGTPVAISAALMIGAGFPPLYAAGLALLANTAPVAFGALGTPIIALHKVTGISGNATLGDGRPAVAVLFVDRAGVDGVTMSGLRGLLGVWPAALVCGGTFAVVQFFVSNFLGPTLTDVAGGLMSLAVLAVMLRFWQPREPLAISRGKNSLQERAGAHRVRHTSSTKLHAHFTRGEIIRAWVPWLILSACVFLWGLPQFRTFLDGGKPAAAAAVDRPKSAAALVGTAKFPGRHQRTTVDSAVSARASEARCRSHRRRRQTEGGRVSFQLAQRHRHRNLVRRDSVGLLDGHFTWRFRRAFLHTLYRLRWSLFTIACMLAIAYTSQYSGTDVTLGLAFTHTGVLYPFFAAMLGWLGVALTGSDTSSNALFGNLQRITAERLGLNPILICTANSTGGVMGKMIDAQSIVVASAATGQEGNEGKILRFVFWHSIVLAALMGLLTLAQAYWLSWMIPSG